MAKKRRLGIDLLRGNLHLGGKITSKIRRGKKTGMAPGSLVYVGPETDLPTKLILHHYDQQNLDSVEIEAEALKSAADAPGLLWLDIIGIHEAKVIEKVGEAFGIHSLALEDLMDAGHSAKIESYDDFIFALAKAPTLGDKNSPPGFQQIALIFGGRFVLSFRQFGSDIFAPVKARIEKPSSRIRGNGPDYLFYALLDAVIDSYMPVIDQIADEIDMIEDALFAEQLEQGNAIIHLTRRKISGLTRSLRPFRELESKLLRSATELVSESTHIFLRDVSDHAVSAIETLENYRENLSGLFDLYFAEMSNRMNEVMKVLTIAATIFMPLTLITGIYGMNFEWMPELKIRWAYPGLLSVLAVVGTSLVIYFKRRKWL